MKPCKGNESDNTAQIMTFKVLLILSKTFLLVSILWGKQKSLFRCSKKMADLVHWSGMETQLYVSISI